MRGGTSSRQLNERRKKMLRRIDRFFSGSREAPPPARLLLRHHAALYPQLDRTDLLVRPRGIARHLPALQAPQDLSVIKQPVLVANGDNDRMVPSSNTFDLKKRIPQSEIVIYKDAGHGGIFQYHEEFVKSALKFLEQ